MSAGEKLGRRLRKAAIDERKKTWVFLFNNLQKELDYKIIINGNTIIAKDNKDNTMGRMTFSVFNDAEERVLEGELIRVMDKEAAVGTLMHLQALINNPDITIITIILGEESSSAYRSAREKGRSHLEASKSTSAYKQFSACGFTEVVTNKALEENEMSLPRVTLRLPQY